MAKVLPPPPRLPSPIDGYLYPGSFITTLRIPVLPIPGPEGGVGILSSPPPPVVPIPVTGGGSGTGPKMGTPIAPVPLPQLSLNSTNGGFT